MTPLLLLLLLLLLGLNIAVGTNHLDIEPIHQDILGSYLVACSSLQCCTNLT